jgi:hypothetical protein
LNSARAERDTIPSISIVANHIVASRLVMDHILLPLGAGPLTPEMVNVYEREMIYRDLSALASESSLA